MTLLIITLLISILGIIYIFIDICYDKDTRSIVCGLLYIICITVLELVAIFIMYSQPIHTQVCYHQLDTKDQITETYLANTLVSVDTLYKHKLNDFERLSYRSN